MSTNYFICTLGEAEQSYSRPFQHINHLIDEQAENCPRHPALGTFKVINARGNNSIVPELLSFEDIRKHTTYAACQLQNQLDLRSGRPIGLLCSSSLEFLLIWLAGIRLNCPVLLIAPECSASDVDTLCQSCNVSLLLVDRECEDLGRQAAERSPASGLKCVRHPLDGACISTLSEPNVVDSLPTYNVLPSDVAYWHHSSGTSSGVPKPIAQSHYGAVGALPVLDGEQHATFTTTPLYHGGPADLFRAWTNHALTWLFPGKDLPITASNVVRCLKNAAELSNSEIAPAVKYFTSVPFVLESMATDPEGLEFLKTMELVGVGGASLAKEVGDGLTEQGVKLVSRYGSAECGFLLSSHRDYENDKDWSYLRLPTCVKHLKFESREEGLSELIVLPDWPHLAKRNREDGSYATEDLFQQHPENRNAWKYHSPAGARLTLSTGKKFDPTSIEKTVQQSGMVEDALVFGSAKPYPGVLVFRSKEAKDKTDETIVDHTAPALNEVGAESQDQAHIPRDMIIPMPSSDTPVAKSSKGTVLRSKAETKYSDEIEQAYTGPDMPDLSSTGHEELPSTIKRVIEHVLPSRGTLDDHTDLVSYGVDSIAAIRIRKGLCQLLPEGSDQLPMNIVEDCGSVGALAEYLTQLKRGDTPKINNDESAYMLRLVEEYSDFAQPPYSNGHIDDTHSEKEVIVLTGATGALGATLLAKLGQCESIAKVYCLVRADNVKHARTRVEDVLRQRQLSMVDLSPGGKVEVLQANLRHPKLGLSDTDYARLRRETTQILHLAWSVNFRMSLKSFVGNDIAGIRNLVNFAIASPRSECPKFAFCSSVASVAAFGAKTVPEAVIDDPSSAASVGYARSKWVAENICHRASLRTRLHGKLSIYRVGQLSGHSETGVWNRKEAWPMMLSTAKFLGCLPGLGKEKLDWLPVDYAARSFVEGSSAHNASQNTRVFHVLNDRPNATWDDLVSWLGTKLELKSVSPLLWLEKLEAAAEDGSQHPAIHLISHWKTTLLGEKGPGLPELETKSTQDLIPTLKEETMLDAAYFERVWSWIDQNV